MLVVLFSQSKVLCESKMLKDYIHNMANLQKCRDAKLRA